MNHINHISLNLDQREAEIRQRIYEQADFWATVPEDPSALVASYFLRTREGSLKKAGQAISYHMTSAMKNPPPGSLLEQCTGQLADVRSWDSAGRVGLIRVAFPLKMFERPDGQFYSTDFLHIAGGAGVFALTEFAEAKLFDLRLPQAVIDTFPGPAYGCPGVRELTHWPEGEPAFGTILKPTSGITDDEVAELVAKVAGEPLFMFIKEDENLFPQLPYCQAVARARKSVAVIKDLAGQREGRGLIFCPHVTAPPHLILDLVQRVLETGVNGIMFSEQYTGGTVRAVRELTRNWSQPPVIYGHNGGITCRTMSIYTEVLDLLARLDGIDFRQTAPVTIGPSLLRPQGLEWRKSEEVLSKPLGKIKPVMVTRAGGLDQGNIILNLADAARTLPEGQVLYLAGSAINSVKNEAGQTDAQLGARAMREAIQLWQSGQAPPEELPAEEYFQVLYQQAQALGLEALKAALEQRYPQSQTQGVMA